MRNIELFFTVVGKTRCSHREKSPSYLLRTINQSVNNPEATTIAEVETQPR